MSGETRTSADERGRRGPARPGAGRRPAPDGAPDDEPRRPPRRAAEPADAAGRPGGVRALVGAVRPLHGHGVVPRRDDRCSWWSGSAGTRSCPPTCSSTRAAELHAADPAAQPAGLVRRAADPARAEPAGRPRPGRRWSRTGSGPSGPSPTPSTWRARSPRCGSRCRTSRPATSSAPSCATCWTSCAGRPARRRPGPGVPRAVLRTSPEDQPERVKARRRRVPRQRR